MLKNIKFTHLLSVLGSLALIVPCFGIAQIKAAESDCSVASISGDYGFQDQGTRKIGDETVSYSAVRTANFDGKGSTTGKGMLSIDGKIVAYSIAGKYAVNSDCSFTLEATQTFADGRPSQPYKQFGVIVRGGKELLELQVTGEKNQAGIYQRMSNY